jgi:hypothetical protein
MDLSMFFDALLCLSYSFKVLLACFLLLFFLVEKNSDRLQFIIIEFVLMWSQEREKMIQLNGISHDKLQHLIAADLTTYHSRVFYLYRLQKKQPVVGRKKFFSCLVLKGRLETRNVHHLMLQITFCFLSQRNSSSHFGAIDSCSKELGQVGAIF